MGFPVLILGASGSGKSYSMRNFKEDEVSLINVNSKMLPFRTKFESVFKSDDYTKIRSFMSTQTAKVIVIDDCQYLMANEYMRRTKETGFQKFTEIGEHFWSLIRSVEALPEDVIVYFLAHIEVDDNGREKIKTIGKLLDEKITIEGMFTIVLKTFCTDGKYGFVTQTNGLDTVKSPPEMFPLAIDNDLKVVDDAIRIYYKFAPEHICSECGKTILPTRSKSVESIVNGSLTMYGRKLCAKCVMKEVEKAKLTEAAHANPETIPA